MFERDQKCTVRLTRGECEVLHVAVVSAMVAWHKNGINEDDPVFGKQVREAVAARDKLAGYLPLPAYDQGGGEPDGSTDPV